MDPRATLLEIKRLVASLLHEEDDEQGSANRRIAELYEGIQRPADAAFYWLGAARCSAGSSPLRAMVLARKALNVAPSGSDVAAEAQQLFDRMNAAVG